MATPENQVNPAQQASGFVSFQNVEITQKLEGPSLPDPATHGIVVRPDHLKAALEAINSAIPNSVNEKVLAEFGAVMTDRPAGFLVISVYPVPRANEVDERKARKVYGAGKGIDLPFADSDNNRLRFTSLVFAQAKKEEDDSKAGEAETDLES